MMPKDEYMEAINAAMSHTNDIALFDLIYQLLIKSESRK